MKTLKRNAMLLAVVCSALLAAGCTDAQIASRNLAKAAEQFEITRRIVFFNGITDTYLLSVEGRCSIDAQAAQRQLEVTCRTGMSSYKKNHLGLSDNVSYFSEQLEGSDVSTYHYRIVFKPQAILPDIDFRGDTSAAMKAATQDGND